MNTSIIKNHFRINTGEAYIMRQPCSRKNIVGRDI